MIDSLNSLNGKSCLVSLIMRFHSQS